MSFGHLWRYTTLPVVTKIYRKLFFHNFSILWNIKILFTTFRQECPQILGANFVHIVQMAYEAMKTGYVPHFAILRTKNINGNGRGL